MTGGTLVIVSVWVLMGAIVAALVGWMVRSIRDERTPGRSVWKEFSLGLVLFALFIVTWVGHAAAEWQTFAQEQKSHGEAARVGDYLASFAQSTLENWQSEFLQLFSFVVLASLFVHKGSAESKDSDDRMEAALRRIEDRLDALDRAEEIGTPGEL